MVSQLISLVFFGERPSPALFLGGALIVLALCLLSLLLCGWMWRGFSDYSVGLLIVIFGVGAATAAFYGWLPLYLPELFPTRVRATGQGLGYNLAASWRQSARSTMARWSPTTTAVTRAPEASLRSSTSSGSC